MDERETTDRRGAAAVPSTPARPSAVRRWFALVRDGLYRPLAEDEGRAAYWVRHLRHGVLLTEVSAIAVLVYVLFTETPGRHDPVLLVLAALTILCTPMVLLLPLSAMMRDRRGPTMFYLWSLTTMALVLVATVRDGGSSSPLDSLLFLTLTYMAVAYSPYGVVVMGGCMSLSYFLVVELHVLSTSGLFFLAVLVAFTLICAMASANSWAAHDRQVMLIRAQEMLAATDPLTGIPNRRAFRDRLEKAVQAAAWGHRSVVCLVDLDGFKAVNDSAGHAAGDTLLKVVGSALGGAVRETDTVARLGGDEFAVLAEVSVLSSEEMLAERLRAAVAAVGRGWAVTASVGVAHVEAGDDVADLMHRADAAMYRSKSAGGDRVTTLGC